MYCVSIVTSIKCVISELNMWTEISCEHPVFLETVAKLTDKNLPQEIIMRLDNMNRDFGNLNGSVKRYYGQFNEIAQYMSPSVINITTKLCNRFLQLDREAISLLKDLKSYGTEDNIWQTLVEHITHEQKYMYRLFSSLLKQISK